MSTPIIQTGIIPTDFKKLDALLGGGLRRGTLTVVGGRPGMGKTSFVSAVKLNIYPTSTPKLEISGGFYDPKARARLMKCVTEFCRENKGKATLVAVENLDYKTEWEEAGAEFKAIAEEFGVPFVWDLKLPRSLETRRDKRPVLGDFPAVAAQYADVLIGLYRESYYAENDDPHPESGVKAEVIVVKNAFGQTGKLEMIFDGKNRTWKEA
ncbi:MAG: hypothetical protein IJV00_02400 [Clostridia bacterium]|nr:hypothetical protein [Clostridia bacterium]